MMRATKQSLNSVLEVEGPKVEAFLIKTNVHATPETVSKYYKSINKKVSSNGIKQMVKHLKK